MSTASEYDLKSSRSCKYSNDISDLFLTFEKIIRRSISNCVQTNEDLYIRIHVCEEQELG